MNDDGICTKCNHSWNTHINTGKYWKSYYVEEEIEIEEIKKAFVLNTGQKATTENMVRAM